MSSPIPLVMTATGPVPTPPATLLAQLIALVSAVTPGYTASLPGTLIEDISSTDVGALSLIDQARVDLVESLTPYGANAYLANQLGQVYGVPIGVGTNTSVEVQFTSVGTSAYNFPISAGFVVSDGTYQYIVQDGGIVSAATGMTPLLSCIATQQGSWAVPANSVTNIVTSLPPNVGLTVNNPGAGVAGLGSQTVADYQAQVLQAGLAASTGMTRYLKTLLQNVSGVSARLVSVRQQTGGGWEILVGGGDNSAVANAIFEGLFDITTLVGSVMSLVGFTSSNPGVVMTLLNHGFVGTVPGVTISGVNPPTYNGTYTITVLTEKTFSVGVDTTGFGSYISGGVVSPNPRNVAATIFDFPDQYQILWVNPPQQTVTCVFTWNTILTNFTGAGAIAQLVPPALVAYINSIPVGGVINIFEMQAVVQVAVAGVISAQNLTRMVFSVSINGVGTAPSPGTSEVVGDPESYFFAVTTGITVIQG